ATIVPEAGDKWYDALMLRVSQNPLKFPSWRIENNVLLRYQRCAYPELKATSSAIIRHLENDVFLLFAAPDSLIVDNGTQFRSREFTQFAATYSVRVSFTALHHPQANPTER
ncbi:hypothetical protein CBL_21055, partial [Carabus blaptoides fortunei]